MINENINENSSTSSNLPESSVLPRERKAATAEQKEKRNAKYRANKEAVLAAAAAAAAIEEYSQDDARRLKLEQIARWTVRCARVAVAAQKRILEIKQGSAVCGISFSADPGMTAKLGEPCTFCGDLPSETEAGVLHRVNPVMGYTCANTVPCCAICNSMKSATPLVLFPRTVSKKRPRELELSSSTSSASTASLVSAIDTDDNSVVSSPVVAAAPSSSPPPAQNEPKKVEFYNMTTGEVAFVAASQQAAAQILGLTPGAVIFRIRSARPTACVKPHWACRASSGAATIDPEERARFLEALRVRGGSLRRTKMCYHIIDANTGHITMMGTEVYLASKCEMMKTELSLVLEALAQATPDTNGVRRAGPFDKWFVEQKQIVMALV